MTREITGASEPAIPIGGIEDQPVSLLKYQRIQATYLLPFRDHVLSRGSPIPKGFAVDNTAILVRIGTGEDIKVTADVEVGMA